MRGRGRGREGEGRARGREREIAEQGGREGGREPKPCFPIRFQIKNKSLQKTVSATSDYAGASWLHLPAAYSRLLESGYHTIGSGFSAIRRTLWHKWTFG